MIIATQKCQKREHTKIYHGKMSMKVPSIIYIDIEGLLKK